jgi:hypothetical protein
MRRLSNVTVFDLWQFLAYSPDCLISQILSIAKPLCRKDSYEAGANGFVFLSREVAVRVEPG